MTTHDRDRQRADAPEMPQQAATSALTRRQILRRTGALGLSLPAARALLPAAQVAASPARASRLASPASVQGDAKTLTIGVNGSPSDLDPHAAYDYRSTLAIRGPYEQLIALKGAKTEEYVGAIAESWEANDDKSVWTFTIRSGVTFQDGTPVDAEVVRLSYERFLTLGIGPVGVLTRFVEDAKQITAPDAGRVVFDLGKPQPLFEAAIASQYGPQVVNARPSSGASNPPAAASGQPRTVRRLTVTNSTSYTRTALRRQFGKGLSRLRISCRVRTSTASKCSVSWRTSGASYKGNVWLRYKTIRSRLRWQYRLEVKKTKSGHTQTVRRPYTTGGTF